MMAGLAAPALAIHHDSATALAGRENRKRKARDTTKKSGSDPALFCCWVLIPVPVSVPAVISAIAIALTEFEPDTGTPFAVNSPAFDAAAAARMAVCIVWIAAAMTMVSVDHLNPIVGFRGYGQR
jgi:hypothetical protein